MTARLRVCSIAASLLVGGSAAVTAIQQTPAAAPPAAAQKPVVKATSRPPLVSIEGKDTYGAYCAVCHGADGRGQGPAAPAMKVPVPDLTTFAARHGGKFDELAVENTILRPAKIETRSHGIDDMPIWGDVFHAEDRPRAMLRVRNLVGYVKSLQSPPPAPSSSR